MTKFYHDQIGLKKNRLHLNNEDIKKLNDEADQISIININAKLNEVRIIENLPQDLKDIEQFIHSTSALMEWYCALETLFIDKIEE